MPDAVLVLAWLVLAHLVADFVLQSGGLAAAKASAGSRGLGALAVHGLIVALCCAPAGLAFGERGWWLVALTGLSHVAIDRTKVILTRRAAAAAIRDARARHEDPPPPEHLGRAWTPRPAALFLADQGAHLLVAGIGWAVLLSGAVPSPDWITLVDSWLGGWDRATVHAVVAGGLVLTCLAIVNVRAASLFVGILVRPVEAGEDGEHRWGGRAARAVDAPAASPAAAASATAPESVRRWSIRIGPLDARVVAEPDPPKASGAASGALAGPAPLGASARVGATIGILERILIVVFVLTGTDVAIGFVVGAKTLARFRLLDDRDFAEYYLLGTLASVSVAIISALIGRAALGALLG
ncbi:MAG TPA: DUF3307 domain-containing protein [Candidatus Limnocylindrales bacterium]|nr:DUF3307 domain-containing protein [Candidatus Limnocylindrales bacterium]